MAVVPKLDRVSDRRGAGLGAANGSSPSRSASLPVAAPDGSDGADPDQDRPGRLGGGGLGNGRTGGAVGRQPQPKRASPTTRRSSNVDFEELTAEAEELVAAATGLRSASGPARGPGHRPGRAGCTPTSHPSSDWSGPTSTAGPEPRGRSANRVTERLAGRWRSVGRAATGAQMGLMLGWLSTRVLGQYDLLLTEESVEDQDLVYFVGPNVVALERQHDFEPREFRLWLALHEVTHRCQFTAIPWMRDYFVSLVEEGIGSLEPDPARFAEALKRMADEIRAGRNPLRESGALGLVATPEQLEGIQRIQALMSLLEGHGDVTMDRAGAAAIPSAARFAEVLRQRRKQAKGLARVLQQLIGLEAKLRQYEEGERFIEAVEESGGPELLDRAWRGPEWLPSLEGDP